MRILDWNKTLRLPDVEDGWCEGCACQECGDMPKGTIAEANKNGTPAPKYECQCKPPPKPTHTYDDDDTVTLKVKKSLMQEVMECFERSGL